MFLWVSQAKQIERVSTGHGKMKNSKIADALISQSIIYISISLYAIKKTYQPYGLMENA